MATTLVQAPFPLPYVLHPIPRTTKMVKNHRLIPATHSWTKRARFGDCPSGFIPIQSSGLVGDAEEIEEKEQELLEYKTLAQIKTELYLAVQGINRGIFGSPTAKKSEIEGLVKLLESQNPTPDPTSNLEKVSGCWKLVYSTITILGSKRTKLGLRDFISLGDFLQIIDVAKGKAVNVIKFNVTGLSLFNGNLTIEASFKIASKSRVNINYNNSTITPDQLMNMFRKNYDILLSIFNPEGWLEITYVDDSMRIGRDDKDNIFILERSEENESE